MWPAERRPADAPGRPWAGAGSCPHRGPDGHGRFREYFDPKIVEQAFGGDLIAEISAEDLQSFDRILREIRSIEGILNSETSLLLSTA